MKVPHWIARTELAIFPRSKISAMYDAAVCTPVSGRQCDCIRTLLICVILFTMTPFVPAADNVEPTSRTSKFFFTSQGKTGFAAADGTNVNYLTFDFPGQATWQPSFCFPDGKPARGDSLSRQAGPVERHFSIGPSPRSHLHGALSVAAPGRARRV